MTKTKLLPLFLLLIALVACETRKDNYAKTGKDLPNDSIHQKALKTPPAAAQGKEHVATILQRKDVSPYTYLEVEENGKNFWIAGPPTELTTGTKIRVREDVWMSNFTSKSLNRVFDRILFVSAIQRADAKPARPKAVASTASTSPMTGVSIPAESAGTFSVAELFSKRMELKGKKISVKGTVLKVSKGIMHKDWVTLSDGTGTGANSKLTITSPQATVAVGDKIEAIGVVAVDQDLGFGYFYPIILEHTVFKK